MSEKNEELDAAQDMSGKEPELAEQAESVEQAVEAAEAAEATEAELEKATEPEDEKAEPEAKAEPEKAEPEAEKPTKPEPKKHAKPEQPKPEQPKPEPAKQADVPEKASRGISATVCVLIAVVALAVGVALGHFFMGGSGSSISLNGRTTLSESELDSAIATYTFDGASHKITARDVLTFGGTELAANEDGTYSVPGAQSILNYAQTQIMLDDAAKRGITATDDDINEFIASSYGSDVDLETFASSMGMTEDAAREMFEYWVIISKLGEDVAGGTLPEAPVEPTAPEEGEEETPTAEYAEYIIGLVGDEWDADANTWASSDGDYYATLSSYEISNDSATYAAASAAYSVAYTKYQEAYTAAAEEQNAYTTDLFSRADIQIGTLLS